MSLASDFRELLKEALEHYPQIKYGHPLHVVDSTRTFDWFVDWVQRVQRALDVPDACDRCNTLNDRLNEIEHKLGIYGTPVTIEMEIDELHRRIEDLKDDASKWRHTVEDD
jgi:hypothetical protein